MYVTVLDALNAYLGVQTISHVHTNKAKKLKNNKTTRKTGYPST